jgi:hypothetical protein
MNKKKRLLLSIVLLLLILSVPLTRIYRKQKHEFKPYKVSSSLPFDPQREVSSLSSDEIARIEAILDQPFYFLGSGGQCYAFLSKDGKTVLKLFKYYRLLPWKWLSSFSLPEPFDSHRKKIAKKREEKLPFFFTSCKIAYEEFRDHTALLYMHLNKTSHFQKKVTVIDKFGRSYLIDLDSTEFALQEKAELAYSRIKRLMQKNDIASAKKAIDAILELTIDRCKKGISDQDPSIRRNFGFIHDKAVEIDIGSYVKDDFLKRPYAYKAYLYYKTRKKLSDWLEKEFPELVSHLNEKVEFLLQQEE